MTPWTVAHQTPLSMEFSRQKHWSGLPFLSLRDLPDPEIKPMSPVLEGRFFTTGPSGKSWGRKELDTTEHTRLHCIYMGISRHWRPLGGFWNAGKCSFLVELQSSQLSIGCFPLNTLPSHCSSVHCRQTPCSLY